MSPRRAVVLGLRALLLASAAGAVLHAPLPLPAPPALRCYVLDVSGSLFWGRQMEADAVIRLLDEDAARGGADDAFALVAFAGSPALLCPPAPPDRFREFLHGDLRTLLERDPAGEARRRGLDPEATSIEDALELALTLAPGDRPLQVLLLTDGAETSGDALHAAARLRSAGAGFAILPLGLRRAPDIRLDGVRVPRLVPPGAGGDVEVAVTSATDTPARVELRRGGRAFASRDVPLVAGVPARVVFTGVVPAADVDALEAAVSPPPDRPDADVCAENNRAAFDLVRGKPDTKRVLVIAPPGPRAVEARLAADTARYAVTRDTAGGAAPFDLVVIDDTPWDRVPPSVQGSLTDAVTQLGTGLLVVGGPHGLALGGWSGQAGVEPLLPVWAAPDVRLGLTIVLDRSGSMSGLAAGATSKIDAAREALRRVLPLLRAEDRLAVVAFPGPGGAEVLRPLQSPPPEAAFSALLRAQRTGGSTALIPPLEASLRELAGGGTGLRHILMLSDGETDPKETPERIASVSRALREAGVTLTVIVTGRTPSENALNSLLPDTKAGRRVTLDDWSKLEALIEEDLRREKNLVADGPLEVSPGPDAPLREGLPPPPPLRAANRTTLRAEARLLWQGPEGLPVLSVRQAGAGRVAVLATSPDDTAWGGDWRVWPGLGEQIDRLARHLAEGVPDAVEVEATPVGGALRLTAVWSEHGRPLPADLPPRLTAAVRLPDGRTVTIDLPRTTAGRYQGEIPAPAPGRCFVQVTAPRGGPPLATLACGIPYAAEWRRLGRQDGFLKTLARAGGGRVLDTLAEFRSEGPPGLLMRDGSRLLAALALALLLLDLLIATFWHENPKMH